MPSGSSVTCVSATSSRWKKASSSSASARRRRPARGRTIGAHTPSIASIVASTLSRELSPGASPTVWKERASPARVRRCGLHFVMSSPSSVTDPRPGRYTPVMTSNVVVLPAPLGPMIPWISSASTRMLTLSSAMRPPKASMTSSTSRTGSLMVSLLRPAGLVVPQGRRVVVGP